MKAIKSLLITLALLLALPMAAQQKSTEEFMASAGFSKADDGSWKMGDKATVWMEGNSVKQFTATQTHDWDMVFGNGTSLGKTLKVKAGQTITFANGQLTFPDGCKYIPKTTDQQALFTRGLLRSAIFNSQRNVLSASDIKTVNPAQSTLGSFYDAAAQASYELDANGNFGLKVAAKQEADARKDKQAWDDMHKAYDNYVDNQYDDLCKKYGKNVIDRTLNGEIVVGAPIDILKNVMAVKTTAGGDQQYKPSDVSAYGNKKQIVFKPMWHTNHEYHKHYYVWYDINTGKVTSYTVKNVYY